MKTFKIHDTARLGLLMKGWNDIGMPIFFVASSGSFKPHSIFRVTSYKGVPY